MKVVGILFVFVVLVAAEETSQGPDTDEKKVLVVTDVTSQGPTADEKEVLTDLLRKASRKCEVDRDCPQEYGCRCDEFTNLCVDCKECETDVQCRDMYNNSDSGCKCASRLCIGCT